MKTNTLTSKLLAGVTLAIGTGLAVPFSFAGPGSGASIWRKVDQPATPLVAAPAAPDNSARPCTDARPITITEHRWIRTGGRGPQIVEADRKLMCTACATTAVARKTTDRNSNGPKASLAIKGLHDCAANGCTPAKSVARVD